MPEIMDKTILKALSTDTRQEIIKLLARRPHTASELSSLLNKHITTIIEHLSVLTNSGLIKKKESTNKWVYYTLTSKGERIFKPTHYSWVIVLSVSLLCLLIGFQQFSPMFSAQAETVSIGKSASSTEPLLGETRNTTPAAENTKLIIGTVLIAVAVIGFSYLVIKKTKK
ncbi:MAG: winged helix-turn-helix domain-containing protein [Candidatus Aenigmarchaeota archaeon]|nr:winged helix-turn-helix domain-containing protein [Candidatus Aenigmarchaeota archaeon]